MAELPEKLPPQDLEAERAVLGAMLIEKSAIGKAMEIIQGKDFYDGNHRKIFEEIVNLYDADKAIDMVILADQLKKKKLLKQIGGAAYLKRLIDTVTTAANVEYYAQIVHDKAILREIIDACTGIVTDVYTERKEAEAFLDEAEQKIFEIAGSRTPGRLVSVGEKIPPLVKELSKVRHRETQRLQLGIPTGFTKLDRLITGLIPGNLIIIGGRTSMGKTSFAIDLAMYAAIEQGLPVAIFSMEMSCEDLLLRMISAEARSNMKALREGFFPASDWEKISNAAVRIEKAPIYIDDSASLSPREIKHRARRLMAEKGLKLIIIDYLQLMQGKSGRVEYRQWDVSEISRSLKILAKDLNVPVVALSQLSRAPEKRGERRGGDKEPELADLRESGAIEQDADVVILIYRKEVYAKEPSPEIKGIAEIKVAKQRNGPTGKIKLAFLKDCISFANLAETSPE